MAPFTFCLLYTIVLGVFVGGGGGGEKGVGRGEVRFRHIFVGEFCRYSFYSTNESYYHQQIVTGCNYRINTVQLFSVVYCGCQTFTGKTF